MTAGIDAAVVAFHGAGLMERVQRRMQRWANLTPEQREQARENYRRIAKERAAKRSQRLAERWAEYQALPPHERDRMVPPPGRPPKDAN